MDIFVMMDMLLEDKLNRNYADTIDIRFTREQAEALYDRIHRIVKWNENMNEEEEGRE